MKLVIAFVLGAACAIAGMHYFFGYGTVKGFPVRVSQTVVAAPAPTVRSPAPAGFQSVATPAAAPAEPASVSSPARATSTSIDLASLPPTAITGLRIPVVGVKADELVDTFTQARSQNRVHDAIDIMAARGTPVVAANDGKVVKLFTSKPGGLTVYQFDPQERVVYYYAHLDGYAPGLAEGQILHRGDPIGFVGSTGNASADAPHLHFEIEVLGPEKQWWRATSINPYGRLGEQP